MATNTAVDVVMPQMGVSVSEGTITKWLKQEGETVTADEPLLEISTDKVDTEVPSPGTGVVSQILVQEGETVEVGTKLAVIAPEGASTTDERPPDAVPEPATAQAAAASSAVSDAPAPAPSADTVAEAQPVREPEPLQRPAVPSEDGKTFVSPVVARIASEHGVDPSQVQGTGRGGRVTKKDILDFIESGAGAPARAEVAAPAPEPTPTPEPVAATAPSEPAAPEPTPTPEPVAATAPTEPAAPEAPPEPRPAAPEPPVQPPAPPRPEAPAPVADVGKPGVGETFEPMTPMRRGIAEHMRRSLDTSAHVTTVFEVDMTNVVQLRQKLKGEYQTSYGVNLTYLAFIARATIEAIRNWPWINGEIRGDKIVTKSFINLGIAVALEGGKGLIVPVVKNAEEKNLLGLARAIVDVADRARNKKLTPDDVQGGTFTITNPGGWGAIMGTPIISQPQVGILDVEALVRRPVVITDDTGAEAIAIRSMMNLCLSYDHRLVDGAYAAQFMKELRENLETWDESSY
jgi:pyruvate dehydrogenase E2 component (dihydrolipoamide acetyltransferase)